MRSRSNGSWPERISSALHRFEYAFRGLQLVWDAARKWTLIWAVLLLVQGLLPAGIVYLTKWLVDSTAAAVSAGLSWEVVQTVLTPALLMAGMLLMQQVLGSLNEWINTAQTELILDYMKALIHEKAAEVDYGLYEAPSYYDKLDQANTQAASRSLALLQNTGTLLRSTVTFVSIAAILIPYSILLPLILLLSTLPAFGVVIRHNRRHHAWWKRTTEDRRWTQYFDFMQTHHLAAAEIRIFDLGRYFQENYRALRKRLREERLMLMRKQVSAKLLAGVIALVFTGGTMVWMVARAMQGMATLGDLALFYQAFNQGQGLMRSLLNSTGQIYTNALFLEHLFDFLSVESDVLDPPHPKPFPTPLRRGLRFSNVTFTYPDTTTPALKNFSLDIPAGKKVAIVGSNGAGKSTLIKLLCRFYDPQEGSVTLDGIDVRDLAIKDLRRQISVMFQFPVKYQATVSENIMIGDTRQKFDKDALIEASKGGGAHEFVTRLPKNYETLLGRMFANGMELSGGEWQRVALARAFYREAEIVVLDEPTSFMDSWAENEWLERFSRLVHGRTAIIITHRFTTAMQADIIHVMERGQIIESGTHEELLALNGRYATSWNKQMQSPPARTPAPPSFSS